MSKIQQEFDEAVKFIQNAPKDGPFKPSDDTKLKFYAWYKQATVGKCNTSQPSFINLIARSKWNAWNDLGDMTAEEAMIQYVVLYKELQQKFNS